MAKSGQQRRVSEFHRLMGLTDPETPTNLTPDERYTRARVFGEEAIELVVALVGADVADELLWELVEKVEEKRGSKPGELPEVVDACIDSIVTASGTLCQAGVEDTLFFDEVMNANDRKIGGGRDQFGKFLKPADWTPPDIEGLLKAKGWVP